MTDKLWCLHIAAPDNIYAAPSQQEAEKVAERHNRDVNAAKNILAVGHGRPVEGIPVL